MTEFDLLEKVITKYHKAREIDSLFKINSICNVERKKNHGLSSFLEDAFAAYLAEKVNSEKTGIWIDQTFKTEENKTFNPDITVIKNNKVIGFIEVKESANPFRWNAKTTDNQGGKYVNSRIDLFQNKIAGTEICYTSHEPRKNETLTVVKSPFFFLVLFSDQLYSPTKLTIIKAIETQNKKFKLYILMKGHHPNARFSNPSFDGLIEKLKTNKEIYEDLTKFGKEISKFI